MEKRKYDKVALEKHEKELTDLRKKLADLRALRAEADLKIEDGAASAEYRSLQNRINRVKARIAQLEAMDIELVEIQATEPDKVTINNSYLVEYSESSGVYTRQVRLVQANPNLDLDSPILEISRDSIIGAAMFGKKIGEPFVVKNMTGQVTITVLAKIDENEINCPEA